MNAQRGLSGRLSSLRETTKKQLKKMAQLVVHVIAARGSKFNFWHPHKMPGI